MGVLIVLILASLIVAIGFLIAFIWSVRSGQYEDGYTPSVRILFDDTKPIKESEKQKNQQTNKNHHANREV